MPEEIDTKSFFESVPSTYGGAAVLEAPEPKPKVEEKPNPTPAPVAPVTEKKPEPTEEKGGGLDDLLSKEGGDGQPKKTAAQYAEERRQAKAKQREAVEKLPTVEEENRRLKAEYEAAQAKLQEYESLNSRERQEQMVSQEDIENLRAERDAANRRYIAAHGPDFDANQDEEFLRYARVADDALRANIPKRALLANGTYGRVNLDIIRQDKSRSDSVTQAVAQYAYSAQSGDQEGLDKAVVLMATALGNLDTDDEDNIRAIETALAAASEPFVKGMARYKHVQENAVDFARQRRAQAAKQVEDRLFTPLRFDPEAIEATLEKDPSHAWANFGALINEMPDEIRSNVETTLRQDAAVLGALRFNPPPLPANASSQEIADHEAFVQGAEKRIEEITHLVTAARFLMGGAMVHLISQSREARERLESESESTSIPRRGSSGNEETPKGAAGIWGQISSNYRRS